MQSGKSVSESAVKLSNAEGGFLVGLQVILETKRRTDLHKEEVLYGYDTQVDVGRSADGCALDLFTCVGSGNRS
jgi:hypothetical protein